MSENKILDLPKSLFDLSRMKKVIDFGCGDGSFNYTSFPSLNITAIDRRIPKGLSEFPDNVKFIKFESNESDNISSDFDLIIMNYVLEHVSDPLKIILYAESKLTKDGILYVSIPNYKSFQDRLFRMATFIVGSKQGPHIQKFTFKNFLQLVNINTNLKLEYYQINAAEFSFLKNKSSLKWIYTPWLYLMNKLKSIGLDLLKNSNYIFVLKKV